MNFEAFRVSVRNALGFETFYPKCLDDAIEMYAFLVPTGVSEDVRNALGAYISAMFQNAGRICEDVTWHDVGTYRFNWCGTRHITAHFDTHLVFWLAKPSTEPVPSIELPPVPEVDRWIVAEVDYDSVREDLYPNSFITFDSIYSGAINAGRYLELRDKLTEYVKDSIHRMYSIST